MPVRQIHRDFDEYLIERGYLVEGYDYNIVHSRIDYGVKWYGGNHREIDEWHSEEGLRSWLNGLVSKGAYQEKLTVYLRCGLFHLALDDADVRQYDEDPEGYENLPWDKIFEGALKSAIKRGYHKKYFKKSK